MAEKNKAQFIVDLSGNVTQKAKAMGSAIASMGEKGSRSMRLFSSATNMSNKLLDKFDNKFVGFATGGGLVMAAKRVGDWQQQLTELGTRYNMTTEQAAHFDQTVYNTAAAYNMPYNDVIAAMDKILERTNDVSGSLNNIDNIAQAIKGIGLNAEDAGKSIGILMNKGFTPESVNKLLNGVASASKVGTGNINEQFAGLIDLTNGTQWQSPEQLMQLLAIQRMSDAELGNSTQSAAAMQSFFESIKNKEKREILRINGIDVYKDKKNGVFKDPIELLLAIGNRAKFKDHNLGTIFDEGLIKTTKTFSDSEKQQNLLKGISIQDGLLEEKTSKNINTFNGALTSLTNAGERWAQLKLAKPVQELADAINSLTPEQLEDYTSKLETGVKVIGGAVAARYLYRGRQKIGDFMSGKGGNASGSDSLDGLGASATGATPVYVTNWDEQSQASNNPTSDKNTTPSNDFKNNNMDKAASIFALVKSIVSQEVNINDLDPDLKAKFESAFDPNRESIGTTLSNAFNNIFTNIGEAALLQSQMYMPTKPEQPILPPPEPSKIVLKIESMDGLLVKTKSVQASDTDVVVDTGKTYGGKGY